jgi:hypothetical protein
MDKRIAALLEATSELNQLRTVWADEGDDGEWPRDLHFDYTSDSGSMLVDLSTHAENDIVNRVRDQLHSVEGLERELVPGEDDYEAIRAVLRRLSVATVLDVVHGIDFSLVLRSQGQLRTEFPAVVFFLINVQGGDALDRENHDGMGYHFHYVNTSGRRPLRTDVLLTFDPNEVSPPDTLFWEHHGASSIHGDPSRWGTRRTRAVYHAARPSLMKPGKATFRPPSNGAMMLYSA